jgi:hypothetical protein
MSGIAFSKELILPFVTSLAKRLAGEALEELSEKLGREKVEEAKDVIESKLESDDFISLAERELSVWERSFGRIPEKAHPAAQILRASVRPFLTVFVTVVVSIALLRGMIEPSAFMKAWYLIVGAWFGERVFRHYVAKDEK